MYPRTLNDHHIGLMRSQKERERERQDLQSRLRMRAMVAHASSNGGKSSTTEQTDHGIGVSISKCEKCTLSKTEGPLIYLLGFPGGVRRKILKFGKHALLCEPIWGKFYHE